MKRINKILGLGIGIVAAFGLASCSNDINEPTDVVTPEPGEETVTLNFVKTPDFYAWSGKQVLGDTRATRGTATDETGHEYYYCDEEVEVNLSLLDEKTWGSGSDEIKDLAAKLSVHVRQAVTTLKVKLDIPSEYIIDSDDLAILKTHQDVLVEALRQEHEISYNVAGQTVNVKVSAQAEPVEPVDDEEGESEETAKLKGSLEVTITGLTEDVINECLNENQDGINFEIYIYIQVDNKDFNPIRADLQERMNNSKISFTKNPKYYINAFTVAYDENGKKTDEINPNDCTVSLEDEDFYGIVGEEQSHAHLNGSSFNTIYMLKVEGEDGELVDPTPDHAHGGPVEVPDQGKDENGNYKGENNQNQQPDGEGD